MKVEATLVLVVFLSCVWLTKALGVQANTGQKWYYISNTHVSMD